MNNLRPISLCCDLAQVSDALWIGRNAVLLGAFAGPEQTGGVSDPTSLVLALVLQAQIALFQGLPAYWALPNQKWAFDVAIIPGMLLTCLL